MKAGNREQGIGNRSYAVALGVCCVPGCGAVASEESEVGLYCRKCWEEIRALRALAAREDERQRASREKREARELLRVLREQELRERFQKAARWVGRWLWLLDVIFLGVAAFFLGWVYGETLLRWLGWL